MDILLDSLCKPCDPIQATITSPEHIDGQCEPCSQPALIIQPETIDELCPPCPDNTPIIDVQFYRKEGTVKHITPNVMEFMLTLSKYKLCYGKSE